MLWMAVVCKHQPLFNWIRRGQHESTHRWEERLSESVLDASESLRLGRRNLRFFLPLASLYDPTPSWWPPHT